MEHNISIGILTFHDGINHGGYLQAYSTYKFLSEKGYNVEIINYKNKKHIIHELHNLFWKKNFKTIITNFKKILAFKRDQKQMNLGRFISKSSRIKTNYDFIIVGADIVWNYEWRFLGNDPVYFGEGLEHTNLISFSPSIGKVDGEYSIPPGFVKTGLKKFKQISVRDDNSANLVKRILGHNPKVTLDPAFVWEPYGHENKIKIDEKFILVYAYTLKPIEVNQIKQFAKTKGLKIIALSYFHEWADQNVIDLGPFDWLGYFHKADYVLSGTFHGTLYSIIYKKNFITCNNQGISSKTTTILSKIDLLNRLTDGSKNFVELYEKRIDYEVVYTKLNPLIKDTKNYLINSISYDYKN